MIRPFRRRFLVKVAAATTAGMCVGAASPSPDDELVRLCTEFRWHYERSAFASGATDAELEASSERCAELIEKIQRTRATTEQGKRTKAAVALIVLEEDGTDYPDDSYIGLAIAALQDVAVTKDLDV